MVRQPVEERSGHLGIAKHLRPLGKAQVGGDQYAGALIQLGQQMKQQRTAGLAKGQIPQLVENHQIDVHQLQSDLARLAVRFLQL